MSRHAPGRTVEVWIPDTLHFAPLVDEVGNDELHPTLPQISDLGDWRGGPTQSVIPDLVSDRKERRVSGIQASESQPQRPRRICQDRGSPQATDRGAAMPIAPVQARP